MKRPDFKLACHTYKERYTMEHVPAWAYRQPTPLPDGTVWFYAPQYRTDREWYANTTFPGEKGLPVRARRCVSANASWPLGERLSAPYRRR